MQTRDLTDRYRLGPEIGRGSIGIIHRAEDRALDRVVAVKVLRPELREQERHRTRFLREARLCGRLGHPNVVPVYDVGELDGGPCLVMALLAGRSLRTIIRAADLRTARLLAWFTQVCHGVAFAHSVGIIHRDIKPAHIFVGDYGQVVLTDWGLAKSLRTGEDLGALAGDDVTRLGDVVGTPAYMAPEQAEGRVRALDHRADIYALGAILYEVLTGTRPYEASRSADVLRAVRRGPPEPPSSRAPHRNVPPALEAVCLRAMAREPADRFESALDLAANIEAHFEARDEPGARADTPAPAVVGLAPEPAPTLDPADAEATGTRTAAGRLAEGRAEAAAYSRQLQEARRLCAEGRRLYANLPPAPDRRLLAEVRRIETRGLDAVERAGWHFVQAVECLEAAARSPEHGAAATVALARLHRDAWRAADEAGDPVNAQYHRARAEAQDDGSLAGELARRAALSVRSTPPGVVVDVASVDDRGPVWSLGAHLRLGKTPLSSRTVSAVRAHLRVTAPDGLVARLPVRLAPGESRMLEMALPRSTRVPPGFLFVLGGSFVMGADDRAPGARLPREVEVAAFCVARHPVTWEAYFEFLEDRLAVGGDARPHLPRRKGTPLVVVEDRRVRWRDEPAEPGAPIRFVSHDDAAAYAGWLGRRLGAPLRLPTEEEWEYAAGGADGRAYPWGARYVPGMADNRWRRGRSPAPVGAFPEDESPFGMRAVAGGVAEWTATPADEPGRFLVRGGSWRARPEQCRLAARATGAADLTHEAIGIRLAADGPPPEGP